MSLRTVYVQKHKRRQQKNKNMTNLSHQKKNPPKNPAHTHHGRKRREDVSGLFYSSTRSKMETFPCYTTMKPQTKGDSACLYATFSILYCLV